MTYSEAIEYLYELRWLGVKLGLENTRRLATLVGHPERRLRFLHVAGTNGKGSTCAMLEAVHRAAGRRVGMFLSPHLVSFRERMQVNREWIPEAEVAARVTRFRRLLEQFPPDQMPTFFEVVTVMALEYFAEKGCELVVWETGMGGRLDATNIVTPLASVITNVQFDHQQWLGDTLDRIAAEKAGIIKPGVPVITGADEPEALAVIRQVAHHQNAPLTEVTATDTRRPPLERVKLPLLGAHQRLNAAMAVATVAALQAVLPVAPEAVVAGLEHVGLAGRCQVLRDAAGRVTLLDGAHNPAGARALRAALTEEFGGRRPALIVGVLHEKDWPAMAAELLPLAGRAFLAPVSSSSRSAPPESLLPVCRQVAPDVPVTAAASLSEALAATTEEPFRVVAGSLYLVGEALEQCVDAP
jgi:dihydrofolate synthase/folylpolyglutamate synthase